MAERSVTDARISEDHALEAAREFASALAETAEYQAFDEAQTELRRDAAAQAAIRAFRKKQEALGWQLRAGLVGDDERAELRRLEQAMLAWPTVQAYVQAQERLSVLCRELADLISSVIGLEIAACCGPGCACG